MAARKTPLGRGTVRLRTTPRPGGNSVITPQVRALVLARDGYSCVRCGHSVIGQRYSLGHRRRASQGGRPAPSNLLTFCGWDGERCHGEVDLYRDPDDAAKGYRVESWQDPAIVPVMVFSAGGSGMTLFATDDGRWVPEPPGAQERASETGAA